MRGDRVVQADRRSRGAECRGVRSSVSTRCAFPISWPRRRLGGRYPGIPGIGKVGAARLVNAHGGPRTFRAVLGEKRDLALFG